jgi:hypothetical protein
MADVPQNANEACPGTKSESAGKSNACAGCPNQQACSTGVKPVDPDLEFIAKRLSLIKHKVVIQISNYQSYRFRSSSYPAKEVLARVL